MIAIKTNRRRCDFIFRKEISANNQKGGSKMKKTVILTIMLLVVMLVANASAVTKVNLPKELSKASQECVSCHKDTSVNLPAVGYE